MAAEATSLEAVVVTHSLRTPSNSRLKFSNSRVLRYSLTSILTAQFNSKCHRMQVALFRPEPCQLESPERHASLTLARTTT